MAELIKTIRYEDVAAGTNIVSFSNQAIPIRVVNMSGGMVSISLNTGADPVEPDQDPDGPATGAGDFFLGEFAGHVSEFVEGTPAAAPWDIRVVPMVTNRPVTLKFQET